MSYRRATADTLAPGAKLSVTIATFASAEQTALSAGVEFFSQRPHLKLVPAASDAARGA